MQNKRLSLRRTLSELFLHTVLMSTWRSSERDAISDGRQPQNRASTANMVSRHRYISQAYGFVYQISSTGM